MQKYMILMMMTLVLIFPSTGFAETKNVLSMEELSIQVMPEYAYHPNDQTKKHSPLLIGYQGTMVNNSDQPQKGQIEIPLPMDDKNFRVGYVADYSIDLQKTYEIEYIMDREKGTISWTTSESIGPQERYKFVIEYYSDNLKVTSDKKSLSYKFKSFTDIGLVNLSLTLPPDARKVKLSPSPGEQNHADEKNNFSYLTQNVKAGAVNSFEVSYVRSETKPVTEITNNKNTTQKTVDKNSNILSVAAFSVVGIILLASLTVLLKRRKVSAKNKSASNE